MWTIQLAMAEWESDVTFERVEAGRRGTVLMKRRRANGRVAYGYRRGAEPGSLEPDADTLQVVQRIFGLRAKRKVRPGFARIAALLSRERIATPR